MALASGITHPWPGPSLWGWRDLNSRPLTMEVEGDAAAAADRGDPGFGAVVARAGQTVAQASSTEVTHRNPLDHDVLAVLREACRRLGSSDLSGCTFYGTAEPCPMCSAALLQTRIGRIVIGASGSALADLLG